MNATTLIATAALVATTGLALAETTQSSPDVDAVLSELEAVAVFCAAMSDGQVDNEIFGIQVVRFGDTCVIANGEMDAAMRAVLEEQNLSWAGIALWVKAAE